MPGGRCVDTTKRYGFVAPTRLCETSQIESLLGRTGGHGYKSISKQLFLLLNSEIRDLQAFPEVEANRTVATVPEQTVVESAAIFPIEEVFEPAKQLSRGSAVVWTTELPRRMEGRLKNYTTAERSLGKVGTAPLSKPKIFQRMEYPHMELSGVDKNRGLYSKIFSMLSPYGTTTVRYRYENSAPFFTVW